MNPHPELSSLLERASGKRVVVIGDLHLDVQVTGAVLGLSPEAPVPWVEVRERRLTPGGAGAIAAGIAALGVDADVVGVVGDDADSATLLAACADRGVGTEGVVTVPGLAAHVRSRITTSDRHAGHRTLLRMDSPPAPFVSGGTADRVIATVNRLLEDADALVILESNSGVSSPEVIRAALSAARARGILTVGDATGQVQALRGYDVVLPSEREAAELCGLPDTGEHLEECARRLLSDFGNGAAAVTRGAQGISLFTPGARRDFATRPLETFDLTGAGDTVTAALTVILLATGDLAQAAEVANLAGFVAVGRPGPVVVSAEDLRHAAADVMGLSKGGKFHSRQELGAIIAATRARGQKTVFTNGCFDLIHPGHVSYLQQARDLGDALVVALNSDISVRALKGPTRPILNQDERVMIMAALESVTWVTLFDEMRVGNVLAELKPDIWVKGADYIHTLDPGERAVADENGVEIAFLPLVEGISTTGIVERIEEARRRGTEG